MNFRNFIVRDPQILNGVPILKGTRIPLKVVLGHLALGDTLENIVKTYPDLTPQAVQAAIAYAAALAEVELNSHSPSVSLGNLSKGLLSDGGVRNLFDAAFANSQLALEMGDTYVRQGLYDPALK